jgi:hypothetical protein
MMKIILNHLLNSNVKNLIRLAKFMEIDCEDKSHNDLAYDIFCEIVEQQYCKEYKIDYQSIFGDVEYD